MVGSALSRLLAAVCLLATCGSARALDAGKVTLGLELDRPRVEPGSVVGLAVAAVVAPGWHINGHAPTDAFLVATDVTLAVPPGVSADPPAYPPADRKSFAFAPGKELLVYERTVRITTALHVAPDVAGETLRIAAVLRYQACNDSTCLPPASARAEVVVPVSAAGAPAAPAAPTAPSGAGLDVGGSLASRGILPTLLLTMLLGLGLNLTPCVYPLISVTVAYFGTQGGERRRRIALACVYVLGITASFAAVGVAAALSGGVFGAALQKPVVLLAIAAMLVALGLSSFGIFHLQPPAWLMRRVSGSAHGAVGALVMGLTMGVVAAPCVGPVVLGLLVFVGSQQNPVLGFALFFALGLGMGLPYLGLAVAAGAIKGLPRSGDWLVWVERCFGVMLFALAGYFVAPLLPKSIGRLVLPVLVGLGGIYLGFFERAGRATLRFRTLQRSVGLTAVGLAIWIAVPQAAESAIRWQALVPQSIDTAQQLGRPAVVDFVADWCIPCHEMDRTTFADAAVRTEAARFEMFKADITQETDEATELAGRYHVQGVPTVIFFDSRGAEVHRLVGYVGPDEMHAAMRRVR